MKLLFLFLTGTLLHFTANAQPPNPVETDTLAPFVTSTTVSAITASGATLGGNVTGDGGTAVTERGIVYSTTNNIPTVGDTKLIIGSGTGVYSQSISGLSGGTTYYVRAYAINIIGTSYGTVVSFTTDVSIPVLSTSEISAIASSTATVGGNVSSSGGATVTDRGVVYSSVNSSPVLTDTKVQIGTGTGSFSQSISGLTAGTLYYLRAYAINSAGTSYGSVFSFTPDGASVSTSAVSSVTINSALIGGNVTSIGGSAVTERGIVYATGNSVPTLSDTKVVLGNGAGIYSQTLSQLQPATLYSVRAYATNAAATNYGSVQTFTTQTSIVSITRIGAARTNGIVINFSIVFAQGITGLTTSNFSLTTTGVNNAYVTAVRGSGTTWSVTAYTGTGNGTIGLNLANSTGINPGINNTLPFAGEIFTIDRVAPTISQVSIASNNPNAGYAKTGDIISLSLTGNEALNQPTVTLAGRTASVTNTSGNTWTASTTMTALDTEGPVLFSIDVSDIAGNSASTITTTTDNSTVNFDRTAPVANNILVSTSNSSTVSFAVTFSENVTGVDASDFALTVSGLSGTSVSTITGSGASYSVVVNIGTGNGSIRLDLKNSGTGITDKAGNAIGGGYTSGQVFFTKPVLKITDPAPVCGAGTVDLTAAAITASSDPGLSFRYYADATATQVVSNPASVAASGTYYIRGNIASSFTDLLPVNVSINPLPSENIQVSNGNILCGNLATTTLSVNTGNSYVWAKDGVVLNSATTNQILVTGTGGVYSVTITTAAGCSAAAGNKVTVTLLQSPVASFNYDSYCSSVPVHFINNSVTINSGTINYAWSDNAGNSSSLAAPVFTYNQAGNYQVKLKLSSQQCPSLADSISKTIAVEVPTPATRLPFVNLNINDPVVLQARTFGVSYSWSPVTGLSSASVAAPVARMEKETQFTISIVAPSGCLTVDTLLVKVFADKVYVPAAFTPNGDGLNDKLFVNLISMKQLQHFSIYNRYGKKMFETANQAEGWDGTFGGVKQPMDTYVWTAEGTDKYGYYISARGSVTLIR